jgi:hypothetical protein
LHRPAPRRPDFRRNLFDRPLLRRDASSRGSRGA